MTGSTECFCASVKPQFPSVSVHYYTDSRAWQSKEAHCSCHNRSRGELQWMRGCFKQEGEIQGIWDPPFIDILSGVCPHKLVNINKPVLFIHLQPPDKEARHAVRLHGYSQVSPPCFSPSDATSRLSSPSPSVHADPLPHTFPVTFHTFSVRLLHIWPLYHPLS